ncbi:hypothetical protein PMAYCL1PPCAC_00975, partial [Pristionchus mayeri]
LVLSSRCWSSCSCKNSRRYGLGSHGFLRRRHSGAVGAGPRGTACAYFRTRRIVAGSFQIICIAFARIFFFFAWCSSSVYRAFYSRSF